MLICSVFLYYMPYPNFLHHLTQCQKLSFQSGLVETFLFPLLGLYSQIIEIYFFFFLKFFQFFFFFPLLQPNLSFKLLLYHVLLFSSCNILFASVTETHASLPPKKQTKTKNPPGIKFKLRFYFFGADASHFRFQSWLLCSIVPSLRLYPC